MSDLLNPEDADGLADFADRNRRAARTARRVAESNPYPGERELLLGLAAAAEEAAGKAEQIVTIITGEPAE